MKKLLTVFAAAGLLVAGGSAALAVNVDTNADTSKEANIFNPDGSLTDQANAEATKHYTETSKAKTGKANNAVVDKDGVLREKGKAAAQKPAAKAGQKPAGKVLPKTSAAK